MNNEQDQTNSAPEANPVPAPAVTPEAPATPVAPQPSVAHTQTNGLAIAALVVGIVALISGWVAFWGVLCGVAAVVLGAIGLKKANGKGMAIAGIVTGGIGALISIFMTIIMIVAWVSLATVATSAGNEISTLQDGINKLDDESQKILDAKKDFAKGETARFGDFDITVTSVQRDYTPQSTYSRAEEGKEYVVIAVNVKNVSDKEQYFSQYSYKMNDGGALVSSTYVMGLDTIDGVTLASGGSTSGNIVFEVTKGATGLKLQETVTVWLIGESDSREVTYTLAI